MKTSHQILLTVAGLLLLFTLMGGWMLRQEVKTMATQKQSKYHTIDLKHAPTLELLGKWQMTIQQGKQTKLSMAKTDALPVIKNSTGLLQIQSSTDKIAKARVTLPVLSHLRLARGAQVVLRGFKADSLNVSLTKADSFTGRSNEITYLKVRSVD